MTPPRLAGMRFSRPYSKATGAILVPDHRRKEFEQRMDDRDFDGIQVAVPRGLAIDAVINAALPGAAIVRLPTFGQYLESGGAEANALIASAEAGSAWTLLYPEFSVVVIRPFNVVPIGYAMGPDDEAFAEFVSGWVGFIEGTPLDEQLTDHWIFGKSAARRTPRWSVIRNVLGWAE